MHLARSAIAWYVHPTFPFTLLMRRSTLEVERGIQTLATDFTAELPWLERLRSDERERCAHHFTLLSPPMGAAIAANGPSPQLGLVIAGKVRITHPAVADLAASDSTLLSGDRWGELELFADYSRPLTLTICEPGTVVAILDRAGFEALTREFPVVWLTIAAALSRELKRKNNLMRELQEFVDENRGPHELALFLAAKRRHLRSRRRSIWRDRLRVLWKYVIADPARTPAFWILLGYMAAIGVSRAVVAAILRFNLQQRLFNLTDSGSANPLHTHHFLYGLVAMIIAGVATLIPQTRRFLRGAALVFGVGLGLVCDEFGLIWNLNPDYYHPLNYQASALIAVVLIQLVYLRGFYHGVLQRLWHRQQMAGR